MVGDFDSERREYSKLNLIASLSKTTQIINQLIFSFSLIIFLLVDELVVNQVMTEPVDGDLSNWSIVPG